MVFLIEHQLPNIDSQGKIVNYTLTKREIVVAGKTKFYKRPITSQDVKPFLEIDLPDIDVLTVESIIQLNSTTNSFTKLRRTNKSK